MIIIGHEYTYNGKVVKVVDGDRLEQTWTVVFVHSGNRVQGVSTSELKPKT